MKNLSFIACLLMGLSSVSALALEITKSGPEGDLPSTKFEIKPNFKVFIGAGSNTKNTSIKTVNELKNDLGCSFALSRKTLSKKEIGVSASIKINGFESAYVFWKMPVLEIQAFAPKSAAKNMFFSAAEFISGDEGNFNTMNKSDQIYITGHKFLADGLCKDESSDLLAKKVSLYIESGDDTDTENFKFGFSFIPSTHHTDPVIRTAVADLYPH